MSYSRRVSPELPELAGEPLARLVAAVRRLDRLARGNASDDLDEVGPVGVLEHDRDGARGDGGLDGGVLGVRGEQHDASVGRARPDATDDLGAEHVGQPEVEQDDVGPRLLGDGDRLAAGAGIAGEGDPRGAVDEQADTVEHDRVVVDDENADRVHVGHPGTQPRTVTPPSSFPPTVR